MELELIMSGIFGHDTENKHFIHVYDNLNP